MNVRHLALLAAVAVGAPSAGHAQIGGLVKKAKDAAAKKVDSSTTRGTSSNMRSSSAFGPELAASSLDAVLRGAGASQTKLDDADQLRLQEQQLTMKADAGSRGRDKERDAYQAAHNKFDGCFRDELKKITTAEAQKLQQKMLSDPTFMADMQKHAADVGRKMMDLNAKGDTAGMRKLAAEGNNVYGVDMHADSLAAGKACGGEPPLPQFMADEQAARLQARHLDERARQMQDSATVVGIAASGMSRQEYSLARERVVNWLVEARGGSAIQAFGADERKLLEAKKAQIMKLSKAFQ